MIIKRVDHPHIGVSHGVCIVVSVHFPDIGLLALQIELVNMILLRSQHVNGLIMDGGKGAVPVHFGNYLVVASVGGIHHNHIFRIDGAQAHFVCRVAFRRPVPAVVGAM